MGSTILYILVNLLWLLEMAIIASAIVSWLVAFDIINLRNRTAYAIVTTLERVVRPVLAPFQKIIPTLGGMDLSPIVALIVIEAIRSRLLPWVFGFLPAAVG